PTAIPIPAPSTPILLPPLDGNTSGVNTPTGSLTVNTDAIAQEMAATLAPSLLQMAHKKDLAQSTGSTKKGGARATRHEKGETHGNLSSKRGNKPNPNKRKSKENKSNK